MVQFQPLADIGKARRVLGYQLKIRPEEGLKKMVRSYRGRLAVSRAVPWPAAAAG